MRKKIASRGRVQRRGAVVAYVAISLVVVIGIAALAVDMGMLYSSQAEVQRTADASALATAWGMLDEKRLRGASSQDAVFDDAQDLAIDLASRNPVLGVDSIVGVGDVELGRYDWLLPGTLTTGGDLNLFNGAQVTVSRDDAHGGSIALFFARALGHESKDLEARALAAFRDDIKGFKITENSGNPLLLPFALHVNSWNNLLNGSVTSGDSYSYDPETGTVSSGADGVKELNLYPGAGSGQLPPGNFGTVDIGSSNNSTADITRQIRYGVNESDLSYFGGSLEFGPSGTLILEGDTGLSAAVKDDLEAIKGEARIIPLFNAVSGPGNNAKYTIVKFAGIRIVYVKLTGAMSGKKVLIQPALAVDKTAIAGGGSSKYVFQPPYLVR